MSHRVDQAASLSGQHAGHGAPVPLDATARRAADTIRRALQAGPPGASERYELRLLGEAALNAMDARERGILDHELVQWDVALRALDDARRETEAQGRRLEPQGASKAGLLSVRYLRAKATMIESARPFLQGAETRARATRLIREYRRRASALEQTAAV